MARQRGTKCPTTRSPSSAPDPAGLSAAGRAAEHDLDYVLLEKAEHLSDTIFKYQKGKHEIALQGGETLSAENVVLSIGL